MARHRAPAVCAVTGCVLDQPCPLHGRPAWATSTRRSRLPKDWAKIRRRVLARDGHRCQWSGCMAEAAEVDHVVRGDDHSLANLQALCRPHHQEKTQSESAQARRQ